MQIQQKTLKEKSVVELKLTLAWDTFATYEAKAIDEIVKNVEIDGFRKGSVPKELAIKHVGDETILREMSEKAISATYATVVREAGIDAIGYPRINITKLARGNDLEVTIETATVPTFTLPDYKKIAQSVAKEDDAVTDEDVERTIVDVLKMRARQEHQASHKEGEDCDHNHDELPLPELTDELVATFGPFTSVADFRDKARTSIAEEKARRTKDKRRIAIVDGILAETTIDVPDILIESEVSHMIGETRGQIEQMGMQFDEYLVHLKKTEAELRTDMRDDATKRVRAELALEAIKKESAVLVAPEALEARIAELKTQFADVDELAITNYVTHMMQREAVLSHIEQL